MLLVFVLSVAVSVLGFIGTFVIFCLLSFKFCGWLVGLLLGVTWYVVCMLGEQFRVQSRQHVWSSADSTTSKFHSHETYVTKNLFKCAS